MSPPIPSNEPPTDVAIQGLEGERDVLIPPDVEREDFEAECAGCRLDLAQLQRRKGTREIGKDSKSAQTRHNLAQELESLPGSIGSLTRYAGNVAAWSRQGRDEAAANRLARRREHDRDHRRGPALLRGPSGCYA